MHAHREGRPALGKRIGKLVEYAEHHRLRKPRQPDSPPIPMNWGWSRR